MTKENKYFNNYGRLEFTVNSVAEGKENNVLFAVYCDESVEGEFPHDKFVGIFKTREDAENCAHVQNLLHSINQGGFYYSFRVEEICTLSKPKEVKNYQGDIDFYYFDSPQYDGKKVRSYIRVIEKGVHKNKEIIFHDNDEFHGSKWSVNIFLDLDENSTREEVLKKAKKLADGYLIKKGLISEPFE